MSKTRAVRAGTVTGALYVSRGRPTTAPYLAAFLAVLAAGVGAACGRQALPTAPAGASAGRLDPRTAWVTVIVRREARRLPEDRAAEVLARLGEVLSHVGSLTPQPDGPRLLAGLRLSENLVDVTVWTPQTLVVGGRRLGGVSGILVPMTGALHHRVLVVREGRVAVSSSPVGGPAMEALQRTVDAVGDDIARR